MNSLSLVLSKPDIYTDARSSSPRKTICYSSESPTPEETDHQIQETALAHRRLSQVSVCSDNLYIQADCVSDNSSDLSDCEGLSDIEQDILLMELRIARKKEKFQNQINASRSRVSRSGCIARPKTDAATIRRCLLANQVILCGCSQDSWQPDAGKLTSHSLSYRISFTQKGETCKLAAFAIVHDYFSQHGFCAHIPAYKFRNTITPAGGHHVISDNPAASLREHAKTTGSVQGEFISPRMLETLAKTLDFHSNTVVPESLGQYINFIVDNIDNGIPVVIFLQVNTRSLLPDCTYEQPFAEHAVVAIGYNLVTNSVYVVNNGKFNTFDINESWQAASAVSKKRRVEIYVREEPAKGVCFVSREKITKPHFPWKWQNIHRVYDKTSLKLQINSRIYTNISEVETLPPSSYLRKSIEPAPADPAFNRTLMTFCPASLYKQQGTGPD